MATYDFYSNNSAVQYHINISYTENDIITSGENRGATRLRWSITATGLNVAQPGEAYSRREGNIYSFKINNVTQASLGASDYIRVYIPQGATSNLTPENPGYCQGVTTTYYPRNSDGYLQPISISFSYSNSYSSTATVSFATTSSNAYKGSYYAMYTACSNPTVKTFSPFSEPGSSSTHNTITWSGATDGVSNPITKYALYGRCTSSGLAPTESSDYLIADNIVTESYTIPFGSYQTRGYKLVLYIKTIGTQSGYDAPFEYFGTIQINKLPNAPTVGRTSVGLSSASGTTYRLTVSPGSDSDGQQTQVYYSTNNSTYTALNTNYIDVGGSTSVGSTTTYYFKTYDGIEYNTIPVQCVVYRNRVFTLSNNNTTYGKYKAQGEPSSNYTNIVNLVLNKERNNQSSGAPTYPSSDNLSVYLKYKLSSENNYSTYKLNDFIFPSNGSFSWTYNIDRVIAQQNLFNNNYNFEYYLYYECVETYIDGGQITSNGTVGLNSTTPLKIAKAPTFTYYNNIDSDNIIDGTNSNNIWDKIRIKFPKDESVTIITPTATLGNGTSLPLSFTQSTSGSDIILKIILENKDIASESVINFTVTLSNSSTTLEKSFTTSGITEVKIPVTTTPSLFSFTPDPYNVFDTYSTVQAACTWPFDSTYATFSAAKTDYAMSDNAFSLSFSYNNITSTSQVGTATKSSNNLNVTFSSSDSVIRQSLLNAFSVSSGTVSMTLNLNFTNLFGKVITYSKTVSVNFTQNPSTSSSNLQLFFNGSNIATSSKLQETMNITFRLASVTVYSGETLQIKIFRKVGSGSYSLLTSKSQTFIRASTITPDATNIEVPYTIGEISNTSNRTFKIQILRGSTVLIEKFSSTYGVKMHVAPTISGIQTSYNSPNLNLKFTAGLGYSGTLGTGESNTWKLNDGSTNGISLNVTSNGNKDITLDVASSWGTWETKNASITAKTILKQTVNNQTITVEKTTTTAAFVIYNLFATVAYRKNKLGINTSAITSDAILEIHSTSNKKIIFQDTGPSVISTITANLSSLDLTVVQVNTSTSSTTSNSINLMNLGKITSSATTAKTYLFAGTCTTGAQSVYTNASCYMSNGHLYSNTKQVTSINTAAQTATSKYYLKGSSAQNGVELQAHASCYMSGGYLYSGGAKVDMGELYKVEPSNITGSSSAFYILCCASSSKGGTCYSNNFTFDGGDLIVESGTVIIDGNEVLTEIGNSTSSSKRFLIGSSSATVAYTSTNTNVSCYMSGGYLYSNAQQVASINTATQGSTTSYYIKGSSTGNGSELYSNVNCYMLNGFLYSNNYKTITEEEVIYQQLYLKNDLNNYLPVGIVKFIKIGTNKYIDFNLWTTGGTFGVANTPTTYSFASNSNGDTLVIPTQFQVSSGSDVQISSSFNWLRSTVGTSTDGIVRCTGQTKSILYINGSTLKISLSTTLGDGWYFRWTYKIA